MKAIELQNSVGIDSLHVVDRPEPRPGPGQIVLKMRAWSLNYRDLLVVKGQYNPKLKLPMTPLSDGVGEVAALGDGGDARQDGRPGRRRSSCRAGLRGK